MRWRLDDTIVAIASAPAGGLSAVVRLSGRDSLPIAAERCASLATLLSTSPPSGSAPSVVAGEFTRDRGPAIPIEAYVWPSRRSYTREPVVEFHLIGSPPLARQVVAGLIANGARMAEPGEFTLRAFLAGRMDLTQAEAVLGTIDARSRTELATALGQLAGGLATPLQSLRGELLDLLADLEAGLDFVDEDISFVSNAETIARLVAAMEKLATLTTRVRERETNELPRVVLIGRPNAGKSSLLNALCGETAAIVSPMAGTTRDWVARRLRLSAEDVLLVDTAGFDPGAVEGTIAGDAERLAVEQIETARAIVLCVDSSRALSAEDHEKLLGQTTLIVATKCDLLPEPVTRQQLAARNAIEVSATTGAGLDQLRSALDQVASHLPATSEVVPTTALRCRESLAATDKALAAAIDAARANAGDELVAGELRLALEELGQVAGEVRTDDLLDRVFSRFCIGK